MSHRKAGKRRREPDGDGEFSPSFLPQTKRSKSVEDDGEMLERNVSALHTFQDTDTGVRRSSRPPKPKVFDDEETAVIGRTVEASSSSKPSDSGLIQSVDQPSTISKRITSKNEASIAKKQKKLTPTAIYDEGHKRETRRSYQSYLEELKTETDPFKHTRSELESGELTTSTKQRRSRERKVPQRRKSDSTSQLVERTTPKTTRVMEKTSKGKGSPHSRTNREAPDEPSPKVRTSSRTPVPKRIFSLLEEEEKAEQKSEEPGTPGFENEPVSLSSPKGRSTSKRHMPKNSFPLLAKEDRREMKQDVPEHTSSKTRSPKSQGSKRRLSTAAESPNDQNLSKSTPVTCDEPSPTVRVSSRGHKPKRTFSLLEGEEGSDKTEEGSNTVSKRIYEEERSVLIKQTEQQKSTVTKEPKRRKSNSGQQSSQKPSSKKELKSSSNHGGEKSDSAVVNVEGSGVDRDISAVVASLENTTAVVTPVSETSRSASSKDDQIKGRLNRRKGKPVKKKVATSQEAQMSIVGVPSVKVKIEPELSTGDETLISPKTITPKGSSKKKQTQALGKNVVKQEGVESTEGFSLSDIARGVIDTSTASNDLVTTGGSKGKRKGKLSNDMKQKPSKDNNKGLDKSKKASSNSDSKTEEHEHIILKLQLPQSDDSTKHKKHHHHHHHHHHHKRKHSSGSHEDGSPKKSHHKKSAAKLSDDSSDPHGNKTAAVGKKKKISIKFKGLLSKELEMESNDLDESSSTGLNSTEKQSKESGKKKKKPKKAISHGEEQLVPSSQSESEHVKLVIKKDKIPTDSKSEDVKTKKISKPTASSSANQKKTTLTTESKKKKGSSPPAKHIKSPQKPKIVTSYLLFCKQHRKKIVEENPGLEFTEISKKVGIAWNNLSEEDKEGWRQKAEEVKKSLGLSSPKPVINPKEEKAEAIDLAAHLQLLGESLCTVGACLRVQDPGEVHGSLSVLLDSALCAISPLLFLTSQIPEMNGCSVKTQTEVLDNLAYLMPGLG